MTKKHLIIGSNSFLGHSLSKKLCAKGVTVLGVYHNNTNNLFKAINHITISQLKIIEDDFDAVYIVSAFVPSSKSINVETQLQAVNVDLVKTICKQFKKAKIVYCSTISVYKNSIKTITEESEIEPINSYGKSKLLGENYVNQHDKYAIVRIASMYGVNMKPTTFLPLVVKSAIAKNEIILYGDGSRLQNYIHVNDVADYLIAASNYKENDVFLATAEKSISNKKLAVHIKSILPKTKIIFKGSDNSKSYLYNNSKTNTKLGLETKKEIKEGLNEIIAWMKKES